MENLIHIDRETVIKIYQPVDQHAHKGIQGHALIIGGSYGKMGSICLSSKAALRTGCGLVTAFVPKCGYDILQTAVPELMVLTDANEKYISEIGFDIKPQAIGIGTGMGLEEKTHSTFHQFLKTNIIPLVVDADCLNMLSQYHEWLFLLAAKTIITPHQKELERLIGKWNSDEEKMEKTIELSLKHHLIIVMKGAPTRVINGETVYQNATGNAALATAGTGDVLTGMITSLLAQSYQAIDAAIIGVYLHGLTADIALPETGYESFIASDIISNIGKAFLSLRSL